MSFDAQAARADGYTDEEIAQYLAQKRNFDLQGALQDGYSYGQIVNHLAPPMAPVAQTAKPEKTGMLRAAADIPVQVGRGVAVGVKALSDVFGADNPVSRAASGVEDFLGGLLSAQAKNDQVEIARIMKEAQDKGVGDQVTAAVKAFATAPVDMLSQALGTAVPVIAGGLAGSIARLGAAGVTAIGTGVGAAMGAGTVKGQIYDAVKQELLANKVPEAEAEKRAQEAQAYGGKNLDQILMGAGIGAAEAAFGAERILTGLLRKGAVTPSALPAVTRIPTAAAAEALPEAAQAAQEQIAQNIALQREGYDVPTMRGVVGQATLEALAGAGLGGVAGAVQRTEAPKPAEVPPTEEKPLGLEYKPETLVVFSDGSVGTRQQAEDYIASLPEEQRIAARAKMFGMGEQEETPEAAVARKKDEQETAEIYKLYEQDKLKDAQETAIINSLLEQDKKMQAVSELAKRLGKFSDLESMQGAIQDADRRVREGRLMARVQSLIDENIPFASTAIADINRKFKMIGESPLDDTERSRVQNIMTMAQGFTDFVKLPSLPVREQDRFAENQAMEALIKERKPRGEVPSKPVRAEAAPPSEVVREAPVPAGVEEGRAIRPEAGIEPSVTEDRERAEPVEPQKAEAEAPKPVTGEAGIVRPEEEVAVPEPVVAEAAKPEEVAPEAKAVVPKAEIATGKESTLWRYNEATGMWNPQRKVTQKTQNQWLNVFQSDDPTASFLVSDKRPKGNPKIVPRVSAEKQPAGEVRPEDRVQPEGEGRATGSDEEARKINEQQAKDAGTPSNVTEAIEEHAFGKQMGAEPFTETRVKGHKAYITTGIRQAPNKELGKAIKDENTSGAIEQLLKSKNPIIAQIAKLASDRPLFGVGMMSYFPTLNIPKDATGVYDHVGRNILFKSKKWAESEHVVAHEMVHYLLWNAVESPTDAQKPAIQRLQKLFDHVKNTLGKEGQGLYALTNLQEFIAEANSNVNFQYKLRQIKYQNRTAWGAFTKFVSQILGLGNDTALSEIIALTEELASPESRTTGAAPAAMLAYEPEKQYRGQVGKETPPTPTTAGQSALDTINQLGMGVKEPEKNLYQKAKDTFKQMGESPAGTKAEIKEAVRKFFANAETKAFSADARWDSDIKNGLRKDMKPVEEIIGASLLVSQSQAVGPDAVATRAMLIGGAKYDAEVMKWVAYENKDANEIVKAKVLDDIAAKYGLTREEASQVAHTYLVAANYEGILKRNAKLEERIKELQQEGKKDEADDLQAALVFVSEDQAAMVEPGKAIADSIPEVRKITEIWNEQRRMVKDAMVFGGLWTPEYADALMDNAAYVPFYREKQIEADEGPRLFMRGLQVKAKEQKLKGSKTAVNDVFENMALWQQYAINRAIRNHKMVQSIDVGKTIQVGDRKMAEQVSEPKRGMNVVRLWREGKQEFYEVADPYYVEAFQSLGAVYIEPIKYFTAISNILRKTVVMYPLFSLGQLTQDSVAAIFASGLKPKYAFKIPFLAVQEFIKTMKGWSTAHNELANYGAVGVRDFNANVAKEDAEITANIKAPQGTTGKIKYMLERIAMSADNAVRQATYIASQDAGLSKAEALEKAFEIINFRRRGSSKLLQLMGQTVPFFYAYLSAQRVAYKTLTGTGISPTERKAALETLAQTTAAVMALSFLYAMANGDDEEYKKTPATVRDRSLVIPGSGGVRIPLRPDFFLFPKVIAEHTYQLITDKGYSDGAKFRKSMADLFANATLSPNVVPQLIKPTFEAAINYSFFEGKPIIGYFEQNKEAGRQFSDSTSEFAKWLGRFGASPQMVDHLARGYFGSVGGLVLWGTNFFIEGEPGVPRPELTAQDMVTTLPGVGAFKQKSSENALKVDFYELRDAIAKAKNTFDDMKVRSPEGLEAFLQDEKNLARLAMDKQVTKVGDHLSKIRRAIQQVAAAPAERMSASEKQERIKELRDVEMELLKAVDVKAMRAQAKL